MSEQKQSSENETAWCTADGVEDLELDERSAAGVSGGEVHGSLGTTQPISEGTKSTSTTSTTGH
jgi:hypothetical protein